jgi:iron complex outermembrane receptor protein
MLMRRFLAAVPTVLLVANAPSAQAQPAAAEPESIVITAGALPGTVVDPAKIPVSSQTLTSADLDLFGTPSAQSGLEMGLAGVSFADAQDNPFQRNLFYRGFEASPLAGDAQGIAVYANGVRLNQPFGDTLNWDLIPDVAIEQLTLEGSNPVFGLNALGGSVTIRLKNGFTYNGAQVEGAAGSFGRWQGDFQYGVSDGNQSLYVAGSALTEKGWRDHSPSRLEQLFADFGWRGEGAELHLNLLGANNDLSGNGTAPVELLAADRNAIFTYPDRTKNSYGLANLYGTKRLSDALSLQGNIYLSRLQQRTFNGDASEAEVCGAFLCLDSDDLTDANGDPIPDFLSGGTYAQLNATTTHTTGYGGALQASYEAPLAGHMNQFLAGFAIDAGHTNFAANSEIGELAPDRGFLGPGIVIDQADGSIAPVKITSDNQYYGLYAADILDVTDALSFSVSARLNIADIALHDRLGTALDGSHSYTHLNPAVGAAYRFAPALSAYAGYAAANRAPTPAEFSCADPAAPCSLTNFFVGDPALKQVVAHTLEAGLRGERNPFAGETFKWHVGFFRTDADNDIMFVSSSIVGRAFFQNVGDTRRQGLESSFDLRFENVSVSLDYSYIEATFQSALTLNSPENPLADADGEIHVVPGNHLPDVPAHLFKAQVVYEPFDGWTIALAARVASGVYLQGDESNLNAKTHAYGVFDVSTSYRLTENFAVFFTIDNLFDQKYSTFGTFSPTDAVPIAEAPGASDPRSLSPAPPRAFFGGIRVRM